MDDNWKNFNNSPNTPRQHPGVSSVGPQDSFGQSSVAVRTAYKSSRHLPVDTCLLRLVCLAAAPSGWRISASVLCLRVKENPNLNLKVNGSDFMRILAGAQGLGADLLDSRGIKRLAEGLCMSTFPHSNASKPVGKLQRLPSWFCLWQTYLTCLMKLVQLQNAFSRLYQLIAHDQNVLMISNLHRTQSNYELVEFWLIASVYH